MRMNSITLDSTNCVSELCKIFAATGTDKTPFAQVGHRHPYSTPYSLLLEPLRNKGPKIGEIGVYHGSSLLGWRLFFGEKGRIYGFDRDPDFLNICAQRARFPNITLDIMDAGNTESIHSTLTKHTQDELFDVLIDDASHNPNHQQMVMRTALPFIKSGGILIIEDISRDSPLTLYEQAFNDVKEMVSFHTFIVCDHQNRYSPGWNNDKVLVMVKK